MQKAKDAISSILHKDGQHDADLNQTVSQPVTHEQVEEHKTHHNTTAVDREVRESHHQTTVQPVQDQEILPEKHHKNILPTETKHHHHGKDREVEQRLQQEAGQFRDTTETLPEQHHRGDTKAAVGEHHHHHIHDHVQPVIEKQTIQPHVVHNVAPVHEIVDKEPVFHKQAVNEPITMGEFKQSGLAQGGRHHEHHDYQGDPMSVDKAGNVSRDHHHHHHHGQDQTSGGMTGSTGTSGLGSNTRTGNTSGSGLDGSSGSAMGGGNYTHDTGVAGGRTDDSTQPRTGGTGGLGENIIGHSNTAAGGNDHKMRETMRDEPQEKRSLLDKLTGK